MSNFQLYPEIKEGLEIKTINMNSIVDEYVREIVKTVDKLTLCNTPTETLIKLKSEIEKELNRRKKEENEKN